MANNILKTPVTRSLLFMSAPISIGMLSTFLFQLVDTFFVGKLGSAQLTALSFSSTIFFLVIALFMGLSIGASAVVGKSIGEGSITKVRRNATTALLLTVSVAIGVAILGVLTIQPLFGLIGADAEVMPFIVQYMTITFLAMPLLTIGLVGSGILRSTGVMKYPELMFGIAGILNLVFDYLLIFGVGLFPELGLQGAAIATGISWLFIATAMIIKLALRRLLSLRSLESLKQCKAALQNLVHLSLPAAGAQLLTPVTVTFVVFLLAQTSAAAVAGFGVASRIQSLLMIGIYAVGVAITPFIAQNYGAKKSLRVDKAIVFAGKSATYLGILLSVILIAFASPIAGIFSSDPEIINITKLYFYIIAISYAPLGLINVTSSIFNGIQLPKKSLKIILVKTFALTVPLVVIGAQYGAIGIFVGLSLSNILGGLYAARVMQKQIKDSNSSLIGKDIVGDYKSDFRQVISRLQKKK